MIQESLVSVQQARDAMSDTLAFPKQDDSISEITFFSRKFLAHSWAKWKYPGQKILKKTIDKPMDWQILVR